MKNAVIMICASVISNGYASDFSPNVNQETMRLRDEISRYI